MYNGAPQLGEFSPNNGDVINALSGTQPLYRGANPQTQALMSAISGQAPAPSQPPPVNTGAWPVPDAMAGSESMEPTTAPMGRKPWGMMTPAEGRAEVAAELPGRTQDVAARQAEAERARALSPEAPALSFMGMPVMGAGEAQDATAKNLAEAQAKKAHAEAQLAGEADLPTTTPLRNAAERAFQSAGTSYTDVPKFTGYIGGWLANEAGADISPADNAVYRLGDHAGKWVKEAFPGDPERQDDFGSKAAHLTGFLASLYGAGGVKAMAEGGPELAAKIGDAAAKGSQAAIAASTGGMGQFEGATAAMEAGQPVTERDRAMATLLGAGVGITGLIPLASAMATAGEKEAGAIMAEALKGSGVNAGQMAAFNVLNNAIAREYYDPKRSLTQGMESDVGLGMLAGGVTHGLAAAAGPKRLSTPEEVHSFIEAARQSDSDPAKATYWQNMHELAGEKLQQLPAPGGGGDAPAEPSPEGPEGGEGPRALRGFYNPATRAVEESKQGAMPGGQWLKMLQGAAQKGVQKRHLEELGVPDFLEGKGKVSKAELLDHMRINEAPLEEKIHEDLTPEELDFQKKWEDVPYHSTPQDVRDNLDDIEDKGQRFSSYSPFPSGKNNREFVIRDPRSEGQYDEPHYGGPVALHLRTWDLDGPNGEKILGVAEIQSTLHQKGRSEGYGVGFSDEDEKRLEELGPIRDRLEREYNATPNYDELSSEEKARLYQPLSDVYREIDRLDALQSKEPVPKAALSDSWLDVGMKRALQYAAENGYDGVTWAKSGQIASAVGAKPEALAADYDKKIPSWFQKTAKKYGAGSGVVTTGAPQEKSLMTAIADYDKPLSAFVRFRIQMNYYNMDRVLSEFREIGDPEEISQAEDLKSWWDQRRHVPGETNTFIHINDKMRDDIMAKGMPLAAAPDRVMAMMAASLKAGKPVDISTSAVNQVHKAIAPMRHIVPEDTGIHVLSRIEPHGKGLLATFTDQDGKPFQLSADSFSDLSQLRGLTADDGAKIIIANVGASKRAQEVMPASAGEIGANDPHTGVLFHEGVHSLYRRGLIPADDWSRLAEHASSFNLMDMPINQYLTSIGEKSNPKDVATLRDIYEHAYKGLPSDEVEALIEEEEPVAHMMELFHHGHFKGEEMTPVSDLLQKFVSGGYAKGDAKPAAGERGLPFASSGSVLDLGKAAHDNWFKDSKVVDENGRPKTVYHGTARAGFEWFDTYGSNYGLFGMGGYFTEDPAIASQYTKKGAAGIERRGGNPAQGVYPVELSIQNPIDMDAAPDRAAWANASGDRISEEELSDAKTNEQAYREIEEIVRDDGLSKYEGAEVMQGILMGMGHDGITHIGGGRVSADGVRHRVWIAFHPEQIKSKFNQGTYDPENSDISLALRGRGESLKDVQSALEGKVKALYGSEFPKKDPEDFGTHGWWALGEGKSTYGDKEVLDRIREKHPDLVGKYKEAYRANRESRLNDVLGNSTE